MNVAVLLLAGNSKRFGNKQKKQFFEINGNPSFIYPLQALQESKYINEIILVINQDDRNEILSILDKYDFSKVTAFTKGGKTRQESVFNALIYISENYVKCDYVFIHDAARVLLTKQVIHDLLKEAKNKKFVVCATQENDSIVKVENDNITEYLPRRDIYRILTPQCFDFEKLFEIHKKAKTENFQCQNDDASILLNYGVQPYFLVADSSLIKLTYSKDVHIIEKLIEGGILDYDYKNLKIKKKKR